MSPQRLAQNMHRPIEEGTNDTSATEWNAVIQELTQHKEEVEVLKLLKHLQQLQRPDVQLNEQLTFPW